MLNNPGFVDSTQPDFVFKLDKVLCGLKQAPRAWYERLSIFYFKWFCKGKIDTTWFTEHVDSDILIIQIYVEDIIFGCTNEKLCKDFESCWEWVWDVYDGWAKLLPWTPNQVKEWWNFYKSSQVHKGTHQEIWTWKGKEEKNSHGYHNKTWQGWTRYKCRH